MIQNNLNKDLERQIDLYLNGRLTEEQTDDLWFELIQDGYYLDYMKSVANLKLLKLGKMINQLLLNRFVSMLLM